MRKRDEPTKLVAEWIGSPARRLAFRFHGSSRRMDRSGLRRSSSGLVPYRPDPLLPPSPAPPLEQLNNLAPTGRRGHRRRPAPRPTAPHRTQ